MKMDVEHIRKILIERGAMKACHRCGGEKFTLIDQYSTLNLQSDYSSGIRLGGPQIPVILVGCNNCGAISVHAIGILGLMPKDEEPQDASK